MELDARMPGKTASYLGEYQRKLSIARTLLAVTGKCPTKRADLALKRENAKSLEYWDTHFLENRSASGLFHRCLVN
jgi:hypothetical protein